MCLPAVHLMEYFHCTPQPLESAGHRADASSFLFKSSISHNYIHSVSNTMRYIRTVIIIVGTSWISKDRKLFLRKAVTIAKFYVYPTRILKQKVKQISPIITKAIGGLLRTQRKNKYRQDLPKHGIQLFRFWKQHLHLHLFL